MIWLFKATRFIAAKAVPAPSTSPGWAIGWWFIPVANFVMPCLVMSELYQASRAPTEWSRRGPPVPAWLWWGATLCGVAIAVAQRFGKRFDLNLPPNDTMYAAIFGCGALRLVCLLALVTLIAHFQSKAAKSTGAVEALF